MAHWIWISANALVIIGTAVYIWLFHPHPFAVVRSGQLAAQAAGGRRKFHLTSLFALAALFLAHMLV